MNIITNSTETFNASTHCAHCEKRINDVGMRAMFIPTKHKHHPIHYFICAKCKKSLLKLKSKPSKQRAFSQQCEDNLILSASEVSNNA